MAKGKKSSIKTIKKIDANTIMINTNSYIILEDTPDIESAITMKVTSHGNRILRFKDENKKARIEMKRDVSITKFTIKDKARAEMFKRGHDLTLLEAEDTIETIAHADCYSHANKIIQSYTQKEGEHYDKDAGISTFYLSLEA